MNHYLPKISILFFFFLASCSASFGEQKITPNSDQMSTLTVVTQTTSEPTSVSGIPIEINCSEILSSPSHDDFNGIVVLADRVSGDAYLLDLKTLTETRLPRSPDEKLRFFSTSPDGRFLAYLVDGGQQSPSKLIITSADQTFENEIPWRGDWSFIIGWLDNENILLDKQGSQTENVDGLVSLNPFTGDNREIVNDLPELWNIKPFPDWETYGLALTVYDPTLTLVVYPSFATDISSEGTTVVLWDVLTKTRVTYLSGRVYFGHAPKWSPNGEQFAVTNSLSMRPPESGGVGLDQELFAVGKDGSIRRLTYLQDYYTGTVIGYYSWSPDAKHIAFWMKGTPSNYPNIYPDPSKYTLERLAVVDLATQQTINYCLPGDEYNGIQSGAPIWSPDGNYVLIENRLDQQTGRLLVLDLSDGKSYEIKSDLRPVGWLTTN
jgi:Tol biopolymer transport system component